MPDATHEDKKRITSQWPVCNPESRYGQLGEEFTKALTTHVKGSLSAKPDADLEITVTLAMPVDEPGNEYFVQLLKNPTDSTPKNEQLEHLESKLKATRREQSARWLTECDTFLRQWHKGLPDHQKARIKFKIQSWEQIYSTNATGVASEEIANLKTEVDAFYDQHIKTHSLFERALEYSVNQFLLNIFKHSETPNAKSNNKVKLSAQHKEVIAELRKHPNYAKAKQLIETHVINDIKSAILWFGPLPPHHSRPLHDILIYPQRHEVKASAHPSDAQLSLMNLTMSVLQTRRTVERAPQLEICPKTKTKPEVIMTPPNAEAPVTLAPTSAANEPVVANVPKPSQPESDDSYVTNVAHLAGLVLRSVNPGVTLALLQVLEGEATKKTGAATTTPKRPASDSALDSPPKAPPERQASNSAPATPLKTIAPVTEDPCSMEAEELPPSQNPVGVSLLVGNPNALVTRFNDTQNNSASSPRDDLVNKGAQSKAQSLPRQNSNGSM